jgi:hypothetical protein
MSLFERIYKLRYISILCFLSLLIGFSTTGCSSIQIGYNQSDTLLKWWIDDYVHLNDAQADLISSALKRQLSWHRSTVLPKMNEDLNKLKQKLSRPLNPSDVLDTYQDIRKHAYMTVEHLGKDFSLLTTSFNTEQLNFIEKKFSSTNLQFKKDFMSGSAQKQLEKRIDRTIDRTEHFFGSLSREQELQISKIVQAHPVDMTAIYKERLRRQRDMLALLKTVDAEKPNPESVEVLFLNYVKTFELGANAEQKAIETARIETLLHMISEITKLMNDQQRKHAQLKVGDWMEDLRNLIANR